MQDLTIGIKKQHFLSYNSSYYPLLNAVELVFFPNIDKESAFKILINDVDHEVTHHIIEKFVDSESSRMIDNIPYKLQMALHVAFNSKQAYLNAFKQIQANPFSF